MSRSLPRRLLRTLGRAWSRYAGLAVVYSPRYQHCLPGVPLDPLRGEKIVATLEDAGLLRRGLAEPNSASLRNLLRVHTAEYLHSLQTAEALTRIFGVDVAPGEVEPMVELHRLQVGGTIHATRLALHYSGIGVHLGGGFHHALADSGLGFCVFNDVAVAIRRLRAKGFDEPILVVDLDLHDGNGTRALFADDASVHTYSIHNQHWGDTAAVESTSIALGSGVEDETYLEALRSTLTPLVARFAPGLVIYLAGADVSADDAIGDWRISAQGLMRRNRLVSELVRPNGIGPPFVVLQAGGYGRSAWKCTAAFLLWLGTRREPRLPDESDLTLRRFRRIGLGAVAREEPARDELACSLDVEDLAGLGGGTCAERLFLGTLSRHGVELMLERLGILELLRARGFRRLRLDVLPDTGHGSTLRVACEDLPERELLVELRASRTRGLIAGFDMLAIEWLLLQNPRARFNPRRPKLPGQHHPGLGILREVFGWLIVLSESIGIDGISFTAAHYHVAIQSQKLVGCLEPRDIALLRDLRAALAETPLLEATLAVNEGRLVRAGSGEAVVWRPLPMALAVSQRFRRRVASAFATAAQIPRVSYEVRPREREAAD